MPAPASRSTAPSAPRRPRAGGCVVNSSDALELAGICDRVLVFSRGRIIRELTGADVTEENIVSSS